MYSNGAVFFFTGMWHTACDRIWIDGNGEGFSYAIDCASSNTLPGACAVYSPIDLRGLIMQKGLFPIREEPFVCWGFTHSQMVTTRSNSCALTVTSMGRQASPRPSVFRTMVSVRLPEAMV